MEIEGWPFVINTGETRTYGDYKNVLIFKFCEGTLRDRVTNPGLWTQATDFNPENELVAISQWIQDYISTAEQEHAFNLSRSGSSPYFSNFLQIVDDENWNGILVLKVDISLTKFPPQLQGLIGGINISRFNAHHFGIEVNMVSSSGQIRMDKDSSMFGLIYYQHQVYAAQIADGKSENLPVPPAQNSIYDFKVLTLQVLFENTAIKDFSSKIQLTMNELFQGKVVRTYSEGSVVPSNTIVLNGSIQEHNGHPTYVFDNQSDNQFCFDSNTLLNLEVVKAQFNTLTKQANDEEGLVRTRFSLWGFMDFAEMSNLDAFSFGAQDSSSNGVPQTRTGLYFSNLSVDMDFNVSTPTARKFAFNATNITFDTAQSTLRSKGLYENFALEINGLIEGTPEKGPDENGFLFVNTPDLPLDGLHGNWYGLNMNLNLGTPGELASDIGFTSSLLLAWSMGDGSSNSTSDSYSAYIGIKLPGTGGNAKLLSIQGVLKLSVGDIELRYVKDSAAYLMKLTDIALKFLGIAKIPPGGSTNFLLFGNPDQTVKSDGLGWYLAYNKDDKTKAND